MEIPGEAHRIQGMYCYIERISVDKDGFVEVTYRTGTNSRSKKFWRTKKIMFTTTKANDE